MKILDSVIATTHIDRHGDRMTKEALEDLAVQAKSAYIPMLFNHDPRIPPLGRTADARIRLLPDGEYALVVTSEVFEPLENIKLRDETREIPLRIYDEGMITVVRDRSYRARDDLQILEELEELRKICLEVEEKKAVEPISVLLIALAGAASALVSGFLNKMGGDTWDYLKPRISRLLRHRRAERPDFLLIFEVQAKRQVGILSIQCVLSSPSQEELEGFWLTGLTLFEQELPALLSLDKDIRKVVLYYEGGKLEPGFAVRKDCVPLPLKRGVSGSEYQVGNRKQ